MIFNSSDKDVNRQAWNIRNTGKTIQTFTLNKATFRVNKFKSVLGFCVTSFYAGCSCGSENPHVCGRIPPPRSHTM